MKVTLKGSLLKSVTQVKFGGFSGTDVKVLSSTEVTCLTPSASEGRVDVTAVDDEGNPSNAVSFTFKAGTKTS